MPLLVHRAILFLFGIRVHLVGGLTKDRPLMVVANHVSWLDIVVLGSVAPLSFVAKADMASWPVFGWLAKLQRTVFITRDRRRTVGAQASQIAERLAAHEIMVLFPEGTTGDGHSLLPFKSPLFEAVRFALVEADLARGVVQPTAIAYTRHHGLPLSRAGRSAVAWPGEIGLGESLAHIAMNGAWDVEVRVGAPITLTPQSDRKAVSAASRAAIRTLLAPTSQASPDAAHNIDSGAHSS